MKHTITTRNARLLPNGKPRWVRCYDNGGETADRYTVCFTGRAGALRTPGRATEYAYRAMSACPCDPQGFGQWGATKDRHCDTNKSGFAPAIGRKCHLGVRVAFDTLPDECRKLVVRDYCEIWELQG